MGHLNTPMEDLEQQVESQVESGVEQAASPEPQSQPEQVAQPAEQEAKPEANKQPDAPFHEHPRFRELVEQKNQYAEMVKRLETQQKAMEARFKSMEETSKPKVEDPLLKRLKDIDPEFGERFEKLSSQERELQELRDWRNQMQEQQFVSSALSEIRGLHSKNNVSPELQAKYEKELDFAYRSGQIRSLDDVKATYKAVHEDYSKLLDSVKRSERESYVATKKKDGAIPASQPKGKPAGNTKGPEFSKDPTIARQELIKRILSASKEDNSL